MKNRSSLTTFTTILSVVAAVAFAKWYLPAWYAPEAPPIPTTPGATRIHRVVPEPIAIPPNFQRGVPRPRAATRKENDKNREPRPAESLRVSDRW